MKQILKWILITLGLLIGGAFLLIPFIAVMVFHSLSNGVKPDFIAYEPKVSLAGWDITELSKENGANNGKPVPSFKQTYSSGVVLVQTKREKGPEPQIAGCANRDKPANRLAGDLYIHDCMSGNTKHGGNYAVNKVYRRDEELERVEIRANIGEAWLYLHIPEGEEMQVAKFTEWQNYFDSMEPVDLDPDTQPGLIERTFKFLVYGAKL